MNILYAALQIISSIVLNVPNAISILSFTSIISFSRSNIILHKNIYNKNFMVKMNQTINAVKS